MTPSIILSSLHLPFTAIGQSRSHVADDGAFHLFTAQF